MSARIPPVAAEVAAEELLEMPDHHEQPSMSPPPSGLKPQGFRAGVGLENIARRTLGIVLLLVTVFLWTASNFLASVSWLSLLMATAGY